MVAKVGSKTKIDKLGEILKKGTTLEAAQLDQLLSWRNGFSPILGYYYDMLKRQIDSHDVVVAARRLKRIESIEIKLKRFQTMRLSTLQDIAGVRAVLKDEYALDRACSRIRNRSTRNKLKRLDDYHRQPKKDGYRGIHLVYENAKAKMIEVQLRTELEHVWATAVEIYGALQETSFKTGQGDKAWKAFFLLLSSYFALKENCPPFKEHERYSQKKICTELKKAIKTLQVIEKLNASTNGIKVIVSRFNQTGKMGKYALLELDIKNKVTKLEVFHKKDMTRAIQAYTQRELEIQKDRSKNIVFVNIESLEKIQTSYPNYFLDTQKLLEILSKIVLDDF